jgi:Ser/Thr protein kinase RdoA (MazF antagonist)
LRCIYSTAAADAVAAFVAERFPVGAIASCRLVRRGLNDTYAIAAEDRRCLLRLTRHGRRRVSDLAYEAAFLAHLAAEGVPVAAAIRGRDGSFVADTFLPEGARLAMLFAEAPGRMPEATQADAKAHGETLAAIHNAGADFHTAAQRFALDLDHLVDRPLAALAALLGARPDDRAYLEGMAERLKRLVEERAARLSRGHCHGDCHGINARIGPHGVATFFDFDDGGPGWIAYDLAVFLWNARSLAPDRRPLWRPFLKGYEARRAIAAADLAAIAIFIPIRHLWLMGEWAEGADGWGTEWLGDFFDRQIAFLRGWEADQLADPLGLARAAISR